jgi:hypothetical protein
MAAAQHNPTRRALLGAALGAPLLPRHCEERSDEAIQAAEAVQGGLLRSARNDGGAWYDALAAFRAAKAQVAAIEAATAGRSADEEEAWLPQHEAACDAMGEALDRTLAAPAPDLRAFAAKLELLFAQAIEPGAVDDAVAAALLADSRRLLAAS